MLRLFLVLPVFPQQAAQQPGGDVPARVGLAWAHTHGATLACGAALAALWLVLAWRQPLPAACTTS
ncbi:MAG: hypothetical protein ACK4MK_10685 [Tepidimonas ignava]